jgi:hypothetical protein
LLSVKGAHLLPPWPWPTCSKGERRVGALLSFQMFYCSKMTYAG